MTKLEFERSNNLIYGHVSLSEGRLVGQAYCIDNLRFEGDINIYVDVSPYNSDHIRLITEDDGSCDVLIELEGNSRVCTNPLLLDARSSDRAKDIIELFDYLNRSWRGEYMIKIEDKTARMKQIEEEYAEPLGLELEELFRQMYVDEDLSIEDMGIGLGLGRATIVRWLNQMDINARKMEFE